MIIGNFQAKQLTVGYFKKLTVKQRDLSKEKTIKTQEFSEKIVKLPDFSRKTVDYRQFQPKETLEITKIFKKKPLAIGNF